MHLNSFRVNKFRTLDVPSAQFSRREEELTKSNHETPSLREQIKIRLEFIRDRSAREAWASTRNKSLSQEKQRGLMDHQGFGMQSKQSLTVGASPHDEEQKNMKNLSRQNDKDRRPANKFIADLKRKRMRFIEQYGYIKQKPKSVEREKQKLQSIDIFPNIEDSDERLFLSEVEEMRVQKTMEEFKPNLNKSIKKTKKQLERLNKAVRKAEQQILSSGGSLEKEYFKVKRTHSQVDAKIFLKNLNVEKLTNNLILYSNRLYGKSHPSESVQWCAEVIKAQIESEFGPVVSSSDSKRGKRKTGDPRENAKLIKQLRETRQHG